MNNDREVDPEYSMASVILYQNHSNPFNPSTTIEYYLPEERRVLLEVYDSFGRRVLELVNGEQIGERHSIEWDRLDKQSNHATSGVYFYRFTAAKRTITKKMVLLR